MWLITFRSGVNHISTGESHILWTQFGRVPMVSRYDQAEVLAALWKLGAQENDLLPTSHGILDRALRDCLEELPEALRTGLSFGITGVGLRCYELPDILLAAQEALLTT